MKTLPNPRHRLAAWRLGLALSLAMLAQAAVPAPTELSDVPLFTSSANTVKPNIMFILDDSGSMARDYMPDEAGFTTGPFGSDNFNNGKYSGRASQCNGLAYNPTVTYAPPVDAAGTASAGGSLSIFDPNQRVGTQRTPSSPTSLTVASSGTVTLRFNTTSSWFSTGDTVTIFSTTDTTHFMEGTVTSWTQVVSNTRDLTVSITHGAGVGTSLTDLRVGRGETPYYYSYSGSQPRLGYAYTSSGVVTTSTFYQECSSNVGSTPGSNVFTRVRVDGTSSDKQNYANWNSYYRTRILMTKSAVSLAFKDIGEKYRVGFSTISKKSAAPDEKFLDIKDFDTTHKGDFYTALNAANPDSYTPLRGALAKAGQYFANKAPSQASDPMQYSCQKNFAILSTDGYWNDDIETSTYGPYGVTGALVGQQDGAATDFPKRDGAEPTAETQSSWKTTRTQVLQTATTTKAYSGAQTTTTDTYANGTGSRYDDYSGFIDNSNLTRCSSLGSGGTCTITVDTTNNHGLSTGNVVAIVDAVPSVYNGVFTITRIDANTFTYTLTGLSSRPSNESEEGRTLLRGSCTAPGQGQVTRTSTQTDTYPRTRTVVTTATLTETTSYTQTQRVTETPYTRVEVVYNGATISDVTTPGTPTVTDTVLAPPPDTVTTSSYSSTPNTSNSNTTITTNYAATTVCSTTTQDGTVTGLATVSTKPSNSSSTVATTIPTTSSTANSTVSDTGAVKGTVTSTTTTGSTGGSEDSLADVAMYYFKTDLRTTALGNCDGGIVSGTTYGAVCDTTDIGGETTNVVQNMRTFTLGLGVSGTLKYSPDYLTKPKNSDYNDLTQGTKRWPNPSASSEGPANVDDLWHAAVNGEGQYFSAGDPTAVVTSLQTALRKITEIRGSAAAAATSTLQPVDGDNDIFVAEFTSGKWIGDVKRYSIDPTYGTVSDSDTWSAATVLAGRDTATDPRKIYYFKKGTGVTGSLRAFNFSNLSADGLDGNFTDFCNKAGAGGGLAPAQCATLSAPEKTTANTGTNLVAWLIGGTNAVYRARDGALGDVINASPLYVGAPKFKYTELGYTDFATKTKANGGAADRPGVLYVGANDGMLHAFDRETGAEKWAFIPNAILPNLYKLADTDYPYSHQFYVDGSPQVGDVYDGTNWRTIIVGGLNKGGKVYYALDVTDPDNPQALWEFSHANLGYTFGNPIITKRKDGTWVVAFASGYNNGDDNGHLFVVDAITGEKLEDVPTYISGTTPAGTSADPSGLSKINAYIASDIDNTTKVFYGGDNLGNVWRFDIDSNVAPFNQAFLLATLQKDGKRQPITTKLELADVNYQGTVYTVVYAGTGRYLGTADLSNTDVQSVYALKDDFGATGLGDVRAANTLVTQTISSATAGGKPIRTASTNPVDWTTKKGWLVDLPSAGERVNVNMILALNVLSVATNIPTTDVCDAGGRSWLYKFDIGTGSAVTNAENGAVAIPLGNVLVAGQTVVQLADGRTVTISTLSDTSLRTDIQPPPPVAGTLRRTSWRELAN